MPNMSYCRFTNTLADLQDCYDALDEGGPDNPAELEAARKLLRLAGDMHLDAEVGSLLGEADQ